MNIRIIGISGRRIKPDRVCRQKEIIRRASLTLECAAVLPIFFFACITLIMFMDAVRIQGTKNLELSNKARQLAQAAALTGGNGEGKWIDIRSAGTYTYPFALPGIPRLRYALRARVYPWIGSSDGLSGGQKDEGDEEKDNQCVLVTDYASVYHTNPSCTHLDLTILKSTTSEISSLRNAYGRRYKKCKGFPKGYHGPVYAPAKGDCYYPSADYAGLTRHVHVVPRSSCEGMKQCERCAFHDGCLHSEGAYGAA